MGKPNCAVVEDLEVLVPGGPKWAHGVHWTKSHKEGQEALPIFFLLVHG